MEFSTISKTINRDEVEAGIGISIVPESTVQQGIGRGHGAATVPRLLATPVAIITRNNISLVLGRQSL